MTNTTSPGKIILVVGASNNPKKFGYKIVKNLKEKGFNVIPINPNEKEILGLAVYSSISEFVKVNPSKKINWVDIVVPPKIALKVLQEINTLGLTNIWFQPGSESIEAINFCEQNNINCAHHACIMKDFEEFY